MSHMKTYKIVKRFLSWTDVEYEVKAKDEKQASKMVMKTRWAEAEGNVTEMNCDGEGGYEEIRSVEEEE